MHNLFEAFRMKTRVRNPGVQNGNSGLDRVGNSAKERLVMTPKQILQALCALTLLCGVIFAQTVTSNVVGTFTDPAGASVPGAEIQLKDQATGVVRTTTSSTEGLFRITNVQPSGFTLTVKANGFRSEERRVGKECRSRWSP